MEDEAARRRQAQKAHIELRLEEGRCVDCGNLPHPLSPFWSRCRACDSLICRTCRARARNLPDSHVNKTWRCPGCGAGPDEEGRLHAGVYGRDGR